MKVCRSCSMPYEGRCCKPCHAAYMRQWTRKHSVRLRTALAEKKARLVAANIEDVGICVKCGRNFRLTPAGIVHRTRICSPCRNPYERHKRSNAATTAKHPDRAFARYEAYKAIQRGDLVRQPCEVCGIGSTQAHHPDYSKPLDVNWLCVNHHRLEHLRLKEESA